MIIWNDDTHRILHPDQQSCTYYKVIATWSKENINWCNKGIVFGIERHYNSRAECNKYTQQMYQMHMTLVGKATKEMSRAWWTLKINHKTSWWVDTVGDLQQFTGLIQPLRVSNTRRRDSMDTINKPKCIHPIENSWWQWKDELHQSTRDLLFALKVARRTLTAQYSTYTESVLLIPQHWAQDMIEGKMS